MGCGVVWCGVVWCGVVWCVVCGVWCVVCGVWRVVCGVWCVVCGVWCVALGVGHKGLCFDIRAEQELLNTSRWIVDRGMVRFARQRIPFGFSLCSEQPTQN